MKHKISVLNNEHDDAVAYLKDIMKVNSLDFKLETDKETSSDISKSLMVITEMVIDGLQGQIQASTTRNHSLENDIKSLKEDINKGIERETSLKEQISKLSAVIANKINLLQKIRHYLPMHIRIIFFNAYILPLFDYCCTIWGIVWRS